MSYIKSLLVGLGATVAIAGIMSAVHAPVAHAATTCVDASKLSNLVYPQPGSSDWVLGTGTISGTIGLKGNAPACDDTTIYLSSYIMPDTWDQKSFPATALPQTFIESQSVTFKAGEVKTPVTLSVTYPEPCKNVQIDMYYGPEKTVLDESGHNGVYISHKFIRRDNEGCKPRVTPTAPSVTDVCGTANDQLVIPTTQGIDYLVNGQITPAGSYPVTGTVTVTAQVTSDQYVMTVDATTSWTFTLTNEACPVPETPGQGGGEVLDTTTPVVETPQILDAATTTTALPATLPATGPSTENRSPLVVIAAAVAAYGAVYFLQDKLALIRRRS